MAAADASTRIDLPLAGPAPWGGKAPLPDGEDAFTLAGDEAPLPLGNSTRAGEKAPLLPGEGFGERGKRATAPIGAAETSPAHRSLHGPVVDFLLLGGGSFLVLGAFAAFWPRDEASRIALAGAMLFLAHFVNHPHFAHSYQIFYHGFARKAFPRARHQSAHPDQPGDTTPGGEKAPLPPGEGFGVRGRRGSTPEPTPASSPESALAARYRFAGIMVPAMLAAFFAVALAQGSAALLGLAANVMFFTVGWHYAKQGYGILMLDAARKGLRFAPDARRLLLWNTHLAWVTWWLFANDLLKAEELWGITYYFMDLPDPLLFGAAALVAVSTLAVARDLLALWRAERTLPVNGLLAYLAAVYVWLTVGRLDPGLLFVVPFFHSLQYLAVIWRYQLNVEANRRPSTGDPAEETAPLTDEQGDFTRAGEKAPLPPGEGFGVREKRAPAPPSPIGVADTTPTAPPWKAWLRSAPAGLARFILVGGALGFAGFWLAPVTIDALSGYDQAVFGATLFLFIGWTFINIHHYFIDNVIWRRENPETRRHLFGGGAR